MVLVYVISVKMMQYTIPYTEYMLFSHQQLAYSLLCCTDQTADSYLTKLLIFIHNAYFYIHIIPIMIQKNHLCVIQFQSLYVHFSLHYSILSTTVMQQNRQTASQPTASTLTDRVLLCPKRY